MTDGRTDRFGSTSSPTGSVPETDWFVSQSNDRHNITLSA